MEFPKKIKTKLSLRTGCFALLLLGIIWLVLVIRVTVINWKSSEALEKKIENENQIAVVNFKSKFNYNIDSIAILTLQIASEGEKKNSLKKGITFIKSKGKHFIRTEPLYQLPETHTAYNINDLDVVIFQEYSEERSEPNKMGKRQVLDIVAIDLNTKQIIYRNRHEAEKVSYTVTRTGVKSYYYRITREDVLEEINKVLQ